MCGAPQVSTKNITTDIIYNPPVKTSLYVYIELPITDGNTFIINKTIII